MRGERAQGGVVDQQKPMQGPKNHYKTIGKPYENGGSMGFKFVLPSGNE